MTKNIRSVCFLTFSVLIIFLADIIGGSRIFAAENQLAVGTASGTLTLNGKKITLNHAYALAQPNTFDEKKIDIAVLLTEKPIPEEELKDIEKLEYITQNKHNYAFFKIDNQGKPIHEVIEHPVLKDTRLMMSGFTWAQFISKVLSKERIVGSFETKAATDFGGYKYEINVKFNAAVQQAKLPEPLPDEKTGKALPPDGGEPWKAYIAYHKAIMRKDTSALIKLFQPPTGIKITEDQLKEDIEFMASITPKSPKIKKGYVNSAESIAVLYLTASEKGKMLYCTVELLKKDGVWRVSAENCSNTPPKK